MADPFSYLATMYMMSGWFWSLWFIFWLLTTIIGANKGIGCMSAIVGLLGPVGLIVVVFYRGHRRQCPYCKEYIDKKAVKCPKCQSAIDTRVNGSNATIAYSHSTQQMNETGGLDLPGSPKGADRILNKISMDKYVDLDSMTIKLIRAVVFESITTGISLMSGLKPIILSAGESKKHLILSYANSMHGDYLQSIQDEAAYESGELFWEFMGPKDDIIRDACCDLLSIQYYTNSQRKIAERLTANERAFDCRHIFFQITREIYHENPHNRDSLINDAKNPDVVTQILNG